jgi:hypothetical protein
VLAVPSLCGFYPGICLTTEEEARKNLSGYAILQMNSRLIFIVKETLPVKQHSPYLTDHKQLMDHLEENRGYLKMVRGRITSHCVGNSHWKREWTCLKTYYWMNDESNRYSSFYRYFHCPLTPNPITLITGVVHTSEMWKKLKQLRELRTQKITIIRKIIADNKNFNIVCSFEFPPRLWRRDTCLDEKQRSLVLPIYEATRRHIGEDINTVVL